MLQKELVNQGNWLFRWRSFIPLIVYLVYIIGIALGVFSPMEIAFSFGFLVTCLSISVAGSLFRAWAVATTPDGTSGRNTKSQRAEKLNSTGVYSIVRHPLYVGNYLMWLGLLLYTGNAAFTVLASAFYFFYYERIMIAEEDFLQQQSFAETWKIWAKKTPAFIPNPLKFVANKAPFDWKAILRREYSGWLTLAVSFSFIEWTKRFASNIDITLNYSNLCIIVAFGVLALGLKFLKRKTSLISS